MSSHLCGAVERELWCYVISTTPATVELLSSLRLCDTVCSDILPLARAITLSDRPRKSPYRSLLLRFNSVIIYEKQHKMWKIYKYFLYLSVLSVCFSVQYLWKIALLLCRVFVGQKLIITQLVVYIISSNIHWFQISDLHIIYQWLSQRTQISY